MLKNKVITYNFMAGEIQDEIDQEILSALLDVVESTAGEKEIILKSNTYKCNSDNGRISNIASRFSNKIISVNPMDNNIDFQDRYGIIYDDEINVSYEDNLEIVKNEFVMNNL